MLILYPIPLSQQQLGDLTTWRDVKVEGKNIGGKWSQRICFVKESLFLTGFKTAPIQNQLLIPNSYLRL